MITDAGSLTNHSNRSEIFLAVGLFVLLIAVLAAIRRRLLICEIEDMRKSALYRRDATRIGAVNDVPDFLRELQAPLFNDLTVLDDIDGNVAVDEGQDVQIQRVDVALHLQDVLLAHLAAPGVLDDRNRAVQLVQPKIMINFHGSAGTNVIQHEALFNLTNAKYMCYVCHNILSRASTGAPSKPFPRLNRRSVKTFPAPEPALRQNLSRAPTGTHQNRICRHSSPTESAGAPSKPFPRPNWHTSKPNPQALQPQPNPRALRQTLSRALAGAHLNLSHTPVENQQAPFKSNHAVFPYTSMFSRFRIAAMRT